MHGIALGARVLLVIVFGVAAVAKARDLPGTRRALGEFGVPERATAPGAVLLPLAEFATAVALVAQPSARWGAIAAACLLIVFSAAIGFAMARGVAPDCGCFGKLASGLADRRALARNVVLVAPAVFVAAYGPGRAIDRWTPADAAIVVGVCAASLGAVVARLRLANRRLGHNLAFWREVQESLAQGLPVGARAPRFAFPSTDGARISLDALLGRGHPVALVHLGADCSACEDMLPNLARWQSTLADRITIAIISQGSVSDIRANTEPYSLENVLAMDSRDVPKAYGLRATPSALIVSPDGRTASRPFVTQAMIEVGIRHTLRSHSAVHSDPAPVLHIVRVNGDERGRRAAATSSRDVGVASGAPSAA